MSSSPPPATILTLANVCRHILHRSTTHPFPSTHLVSPCFLMSVDCVCGGVAGLFLLNTLSPPLTPFPYPFPSPLPFPHPLSSTRPFPYPIPTHTHRSTNHSTHPSPISHAHSPPTDGCTCCCCCCCCSVVNEAETTV